LLTKFRLSDHNLEIAIPKRVLYAIDYLNCFSDIEDPDPSDSIIEDQPVTFDIVEDVPTFQVGTDFVESLKA
jgi:hypothetical protein